MFFRTALFSSIFLLSSCSSIQFSQKPVEIESLTYEELSFDELPSKIRNILINGLDAETIYYDNYNRSYIPVIFFDSDRFTYRHIESKLVTAWSSHSELLDNDTRTTYKIASLTPMPIIVFENNIYISNEYNTLSHIGNKDYLDGLNFTKYNLRY